MSFANELTPFFVYLVHLISFLDQDFSIQSFHYARISIPFLLKHRDVVFPFKVFAAF